MLRLSWRQAYSRRAISTILSILPTLQAISFFRVLLLQQATVKPQIFHDCFLMQRVLVLIKSGMGLSWTKRVRKRSIHWFLMVRVGDRIRTFLLIRRTTSKPRIVLLDPGVATTFSLSACMRLSSSAKTLAWYFRHGYLKL